MRCLQIGVLPNWPEATSRIRLFPSPLKFPIYPPLDLWDLRILCHDQVFDGRIGIALSLSALDEINPWLDYVFLDAFFFDFLWGYPQDFLLRQCCLPTTPLLHTTLTRSSGRCLLLLDRLYLRLVHLSRLRGCRLSLAVSVFAFRLVKSEKLRLRSATFNVLGALYFSVYLVGILIDPIKDPTWPSLGFAFLLSLTSLAHYSFESALPTSYLPTFLIPMVPILRIPPGRAG